VSYGERLERFRQGSGSLAFKCITDRDKFVANLRDRANNPFLIQQGFTPLCGPAAFMHCIAIDRPADYVHYVLDLAEHGVGKLGGLTVKPGDSCRSASLLVTAGKITRDATDPVDWVALASLRDSSNLIFDMNGPRSDIAGITLGRAMADWFSATGWFPGGVVDATHYQSSSPYYNAYDNLLSINQRVNSHVCLLIRNAIVEPSSGLGINKFDGSGTPKSGPTADYWVVLKTRITLDHKTPPLPGMLPFFDLRELRNQRINFRFWNWGDRNTTSVNNRIDNITFGQFLQHYYGYVSATR